MKKKILYSTILNLIEKGRRDPRWLKKIVALTLVLSLFFMVSIGFLFYFAVGMAKDLVAGRPDMDLLAMEQLIAKKSLVLSEEQQHLLTPLIEGLAVSGLAPEQATAMKTQLFKIITPAQSGKMEAWKAEAATKAAGFFTLPPAVAVFIEDYTGLSRKIIEAKIDAFLAWWQMTKPENSAEQLQKTMRSL